MILQINKKISFLNVTHQSNCFNQPVKILLNLFAFITGSKVF